MLQDGKTCLHVAVWRGHENVVRILVDAGADVNIPDSVYIVLLNVVVLYIYVINILT